MPKKTTTALSRAIQSLRIRRAPCTCDEIAARIGVSGDTWQAWERGERTPSEQSIRKINQIVPGTKRGVLDIVEEIRAAEGSDAVTTPSNPTPAVEVEVEAAETEESETS